jgi:hypothetical protein
MAGLVPAINVFGGVLQRRGCPAHRPAKRRRSSIRWWHFSKPLT